ncbi:MAG TPA: hypothetical protein DCY88_26855 [Cyanobacteria bacterium UBA11372]|nr:hypothetical protein [Cyanobacteria bacterium UBA11372]HBE36912.1 hypothetical protein [Cyanobacteria bacterium UBA11368]HBE51763.1 hypothetical protein [Cyanobacteria bacterium UBA11369]
MFSPFIVRCVATTTSVNYLSNGWKRDRFMQVLGKLRLKSPKKYKSIKLSFQQPRASIQREILYVQL